jgi:Zn-dependent protease with chaperone function
MASPITPPPESSHGENALEIGLAALHAKDYQNAIASLEIASQANLKESSRLRAIKGLMLAYQHIGDTESAIRLITPLTQHRHEKVKTWANHQLNQLTKHLSPEPQVETPQISYSASGIEAGFVPFNSPVSPPPSPSPKPASSEPSGFIPLTPPPVPPPPKTTRKKPTPQPPQIKSESFTPTVSPIPETPENPPNLTTESPNTSTKEEDETSEKYQLVWRNSQRAENWRPMKTLKLSRFWLEQLVSAIALYWLTREVVKFLFVNTNNLLSSIPFLKPIPAFYQDPTPWLYLLFIVLLIGSPWIMDKLLEWFYGLKNLPLGTLMRISQESNRTLRNYTKKTGNPFPNLKLLPISAPVAMSYGSLPRFARIVVSQGLLDQLTPEEIATIYASELGSIRNKDFILMSLATLLLQIPYTIYWQAAYWGTRVPELKTLSLPAWIPAFISPILNFISPALHTITVLISALGYGIYWLLRWPFLWVSRQRVYYRDRFACDLTGNPNGLTRALLKIAIGLADDIQQQQQTPYLLEGFDLLTPVATKHAIVLGSVAPLTPLEPLLQWDLNNPARKWLILNHTHPLMGERLQILQYYARVWKLDPEINLLTNEKEEGRGKKKEGRKLSLVSFPHISLPSPQVMLLGAPFFGIPMGVAIVSILWGVSIFLSLMGVWQLEWMKGDIGLLLGCLPIGFSLGTFIRINDFFPDIKPFKVKTPTLPEVLSNPNALPIDSETIRMEGKLLGRKGIDNCLQQDLILQTNTGLIRLHHVSQLGIIGNLWPQKNRPSDLIGTNIVVTGWLRRGVTPWIDIESLRSQNGKVCQSYHPIWSTILASLTACWGAYIIFRGGI